MVRARALALLCCVAARLVSAQIRVLSPRTLVQALGSGKPKELGKIKGSTAVFGAPFYGDRVLGRLVWAQSKGHHHCSDEDYDVPPPAIHHSGSASHDQVKLINIVMVRRGECTFVTKTRVAAKKGAHAVIIVDKEDSKMTAKDLQNIIVADDGYGSTITIPSILISRFDGDLLINTIKSTEVVVELAWDIPTDTTVAIDFWMSSASHDSQKFIQKFSEARKTLNEVVKFTPHYHVFSADSLGGYSGLCWDHDAKYCAEDPDGSGMVTGKQVLEEDVRQLCIHELTRVPRSRIDDKTGVRPVVFYAEQWWDYVSQMPDRCKVDAEDPTVRFGKECSLALMTDVGIDVTAVQSCVEKTWEKKLESERINKAWSPRALRVNGWRYNGMLDADLVTRAVCAGFIRKPAECETLLEVRDPLAEYRGDAGKSDGVSFGTLFKALLGVLVVVTLAACLYKRFIEKRLKVQIREDVMLEVNNQMASYRQLANSA